jgi:putative FmdB family regulatory protein
MPTYEYKCAACGHRLEAFQSMTDRPLRKCPACGRSALERQIGVGAAVLFKGPGFYQTDYRSESYRKAAEAESKPASAPAASDAPAKAAADGAGAAAKAPTPAKAPMAGNTDRKPATARAGRRAPKD